MIFMHSPRKPITILWIQEGVTQGDLLTMILYRIALLLFVEKLQAAFPDVMQPWYANGSGLFWHHAHNAWCLNLLLQLGPWFGYYPETAKSWHRGSQGMPSLPEGGSSNAVHMGKVIHLRLCGIGGLLGSLDCGESGWVGVWGANPGGHCKILPANCICRPDLQS